MSKWRTEGGSRSAPGPASTKTRKRSEGQRNETERMINGDFRIVDPSASCRQSPTDPASSRTVQRKSNQQANNRHSRAGWFSFAGGPKEAATAGASYAYHLTGSVGVPHLKPLFLPSRSGRWWPCQRLCRSVSTRIAKSRRKSWEVEHLAT